MQVAQMYGIITATQMLKILLESMPFGTDEIQIPKVRYITSLVILLWSLEVEIEEHFVNVDTGCYIKKHDYDERSAFCVQTQEVASINRIG
jgi:hypothetical protein